MERGFGFSELCTLKNYFIQTNLYSPSVEKLLTSENNHHQAKAK